MKVIRVGRGLDNDIQLQNDLYASRNHCRLILDDGGNYVLEDLNSTNGTYVNGQRIYNSVYLRPGDQVQIGNTVLPWESYFMHNQTVVKPVNQPQYNPPQYNPPKPPSDSYDRDERPVSSSRSSSSSSSSFGVLTLLTGLGSIGAIVYIVISYFSSLLYLGASMSGEVFKGFVLYLHGIGGLGGQWFAMIAAIVLGGLTDLFGSLDDEKGGAAKSVGLSLGNIGMVIGIVFLCLALFWKQILGINDLPLY